MTDDNIFYIVSDEYIESHVMQNKPQKRTYHRKYVGILTAINGFIYFVPMSSPKDKDYANGKINSSPKRQALHDKIANTVVVYKYTTELMSDE